MNSMTNAKHITCQLHVHCKTVVVFFGLLSFCAHSSHKYARVRVAAAVGVVCTREEKDLADE